MAPHINGPLNYECLGKHGPPMVFIHPTKAILSSPVC